MAIESNLATKKCIADALFLIGIAELVVGTRLGFSGSAD